MKTLIISLLVAIHGGAALAAPSWKVEEEKRIYYAQTPRLSVNLSPLEVDESAWDLLTVSLSFEIEDAKAEVNALKKNNPGYAVSKVSVSGYGTYRIEVPSLGISEAVDLSSGLEGPYFDWKHFVPKKDSARVRAAFADLSNFAHVSGGLRASVPADQVVESVRVPGSICADLTAKGRDIYSVALSLPSVEEKIRELAKEEENRKVLRDQVLRNCLELKRSAYVYDFAELLTLKVDEPRVNQDFTAELKRKVQQDQVIPLSYRLVRQ
jgi:hypothetical protein